MSELGLEARLHVEVEDGRNAFRVESELCLEAGVLVLFGPSGAGKSLTLEALAGLVRPRAGFVRVAGQALYDSKRGIEVPPHQRALGYVPQQDALFPFQDVLGNVAFGLTRAQRRRDADKLVALLEELGIEHLKHARPEVLSGGERRRVALARALAVEPRLLLLDEPFAAIDHAGRAQLHQVLRETLERRSISAVFVTHDPNEAMAIGDSLVRFTRGRTLDSGPPKKMLSEAMVNPSF